MFPDAWNVLLVSLLERVRTPAHCALLELTRMKQDKAPAKHAPLERGPLKRAPSLSLTAFQSVDMEHTAPVAWFLALNVPGTATPVSHHSMDSRNASLALMICTPSNLVQMRWACAETNALLDNTLKLVLPHVPLVPSTFSNH